MSATDFTPPTTRPLLRELCMEGSLFAMQQFSTDLLRVLSACPRECMWSRLSVSW